MYRIERAERRIAARLDELEAARGHIREYRAHHAAALAGRSDEPLAPADPRRSGVA